MKQWLILFFLFSFMAMAQKGQKNLDAQEFMKRKQMLMERIMKMALEGDQLAEIEEAMKEFQNDEGFFPKDMWNDQIFQDMENKMQEDLGGFRAWAGSSGASYEWKETEKERILEITPKDKNTPLNIQINKGVIEISSEMKEENLKEKSRSMNMTSFKQSFTAPEDVETEKAQIENKEGKVIVRFPLKSGVTGKVNNKKTTVPVSLPEKKKKSGEERVPLKARPGDVTI